MRYLIISSDENFAKSMVNPKKMYCSLPWYDMYFAFWWFCFIWVLLSKSKSKYCLLDPLLTVLLKRCLVLLGRYITTIVNCSLHQSFLPSCLKQVIITPSFMKLSFDYNELSNYRPIQICLNHLDEKERHKIFLSWQDDFISLLSWIATLNMTLSYKAIIHTSMKASLMTLMTVIKTTMATSRTIWIMQNIAST